MSNHQWNGSRICSKIMEKNVVVIVTMATIFFPPPGNVVLGGGDKCGIKGIFWEYSRKGFAFIKEIGPGDGRILYYSHDFQFIETDQKPLNYATKKPWDVFSFEKGTSGLDGIIKSNNFASFTKADVTTVVVANTSEVIGATYYDSKKALLLMYKQVIVNFATGKSVSYTPDEVENEKVPIKMQFNVSSSSAPSGDTFLLLWGHPDRAQYYSTQPLETFTGDDEKFLLNPNKYIYNSVERMLACKVDICIDSFVDGGFYIDETVTFFKDRTREGVMFAKCDTAVAGFAYRGKSYIIFPTNECNEEPVQDLFGSLPMRGMDLKTIEAAMTINDTLYILSDINVAIMTIELHKRVIQMKNFEGIKNRTDVWPGLKMNVDAAFYNDADGLTYFIDREYHITYRGFTVLHNGWLKPNLGNLFPDCENFDYGNYVGKMFGITTMDEYVTKIVRPRQGCGRMCPNKFGRWKKKSDNTILIIIIAVVASILLISAICLLLIVFFARRRRWRQFNELSTEKNSFWHSDMTNIRTEKSKGNLEATVNPEPKPNTKVKPNNEVKQPTNTKPDAKAKPMTNINADTKKKAVTTTDKFVGPIQSPTKNR